LCCSSFSHLGLFADLWISFTRRIIRFAFSRMRITATLLRSLHTFCPRTVRLRTGLDRSRLFVWFAFTHWFLVYTLHILAVTLIVSFTYTPVYRHVCTVGSFARFLTTRFNTHAGLTRAILHCTVHHWLPRSSRLIHVARFRLDHCAFAPFYCTTFSAFLP